MQFLGAVNAPLRRISFQKSAVSDALTCTLPVGVWKLGPSRLCKRRLPDSELDLEPLRQFNAPLGTFALSCYVRGNNESA